MHIITTPQVLGGEDTPLHNVLKSNEEREWLLDTKKEMEQEAVTGDKKLRSYNMNDINERLLEIESDKAEARYEPL